MKRLALLAVTAFMAVILSACGESAQKKAEKNASAQQSQDSLGNAAKDADAKLQQGAGAETSPSQPAQSGQ